MARFGKADGRQLTVDSQKRREIAQEDSRGVSQVWQAKGLRECVLGSVANKGVTQEIVEVWQTKELERVEERSFDSLRSLRMTILVG